MAVCNMCGATFEEPPGVSRPHLSRTIWWPSVLALFFTFIVVVRLLQFSEAAIGYTAWGVLVAVVLVLVVVWFLLRALNPVLADGFTSQYCPSCADAIIECKRRPEESAPHKVRIRKGS